MPRLPIAAALVIASSLAAAAQTVVVERAAAGPLEPRGDIVRVQVSVGFFVAAPAGDGEAALQAQERARRAIYETAGRECEVLRATIAGECRLESITVNINRQFGQPQQEGFQAGGNFSFRVTLK